MGGEPRRGGDRARSGPTGRGLRPLGVRELSQELARDGDPYENIAAAPVPMGGGGLSPDGGMAELMLVPSARFLVPAGPEPPSAALLADAGLTL